MLTCQEVTELVTDYLERRMPFGQRMSFAMHIAMCPNCRRYVRQLRTTVRTLGSLPPDFALPPDIEAQLLTQFRGAHPAQPGRNTRLRLLAALDAYLGRRAGVLLITVSMLGLAALNLTFGHDGGYATHAVCAVMDVAAILGYGLVAGLLLRGVARASGMKLSAVTYASLTLLSALPWYGVTMWRCPLADVARHAVVFHVGSLFLATLLAAAIGSRAAQAR